MMALRGGILLFSMRNYALLFNFYSRNDVLLY